MGNAILIDEEEAGIASVSGIPAKVGGCKRLLSTAWRDVLLVISPRRTLSSFLENLGRKRQVR